ncbi:hypothetical protein CH373_18390, partial [Leptospira perolatii]
VAENKQATEDWAERALRFSQAETKIKDRMEDLKKQIASERNTLQSSLNQFLVPQAGLFNASGLNGLVDVGSSKYKTLETNLRSEYNIMEGVLSGKIGMWDFINGVRGQTGPPATFGSGLSSKYPQYDIYGFVRTRLNGGEPSYLMRIAQDAFNGVWFIEEDDKASSTANLRLESDTYSQYESRMNAKLEQITNAEAIIIAIMGWGNPLVGAAAIQAAEKWSTTKTELQNSISNATASATKLKDLQAELNYYTDISSAEQLRSVLLGTGNSAGKYKLNTGLQSSDTNFLNGAGTLTAGSLQWTAGKEGLNLDKIAGKNGDPVAQDRYIHDAYGLLVRNNTNYTPGGTTAVATSSIATGSDGVKTAFMVSGDEFVSALAVLSRSQYEIERDEYFAAQEASVGPGGQKADKREILDDREQFFSQLINKLSNGNAQNIEFEMYQTVVSDYMGKGKTVDQLFELSLEQQRKAQIASWDAKEKDFQARKQEWVQNIQYLQDTGNARFNDLTGVILKQWDEWRSDFRKQAKEGEEAHLREIEKAIKEKSSWEKDFLSTMKDQDDSTVLRDAYNQIQGMIESFGGTLPTGVSLNLNANTILNSVLADSPGRFDEKLVSEGAAQDVQFFINQLQTTKLDEKNVKAFTGLREEMDQHSQKMVVLQTLDSLYSIPKAYEETIKSANEDLHKQLKSQLTQDQFMPVGNVYIRQTVGPDGNPQAQVLPGYTDFIYNSPDLLPKVKDSNGKEWDLTDFNTLAGKGGPTSAELQTMVRLAQTQMDLDFKRIYDPENPTNREIAITALDPVAVAKVAQAAQASLRQLFTDPQKALEYTNADERGKRAMEESAMNSGYLVGPTEGGKFGDHHFSQFYTILKLKEKYNEMKQEGESLKGDGFSNAMGSVMEASTFGLLDGKMISKTLHDNKEIVDAVTAVAAVIAAPFTGGASFIAYAAYKSVQGAYEGGVLGAVAGAANFGNAYLQGFSAGAISYGMSYSYEDGFQASVGGGLGKAGLGFGGSLSYSANTGAISGSLGLQARMVPSSRITANLGVNFDNSGFTGVNTGFGVGMGTNSQGGPLASLNVGLSYDKNSGFGQTVGISQSVNRAVSQAGLDYSHTAFGGDTWTASTPAYLGTNASYSYNNLTKSATATLNSNGATALTYDLASGTAKYNDSFFGDLGKAQAMSLGGMSDEEYKKHINDQKAIRALSQGLWEDTIGFFSGLFSSDTSPDSQASRAAQESARGNLVKDMLGGLVHREGEEEPDSQQRFAEGKRKLLDTGKWADPVTGNIYSLENGELKTYFQDLTTGEIKVRSVDAQGTEVERPWNPSSDVSFGTDEAQLLLTQSRGKGDKNAFERYNRLQLNKALNNSDRATQSFESWANKLGSKNLPELQSSIEGQELGLYNQLLDQAVRKGKFDDVITKQLGVDLNTFEGSNLDFLSLEQKAIDIFEKNYNNLRMPLGDMGAATGTLNFLYKFLMGLGGGGLLDGTMAAGQAVTDNYVHSKTKIQKMNELTDRALNAARDPSKDIFTEIERLNQLRSQEYWTTDPFGTILTKKGTPLGNYEMNFMLQIYRIERRRLELAQ